MIDKFRGEYFFLSNFYPCSVEYNGITYKSSEAAYQAQKCPERSLEFINLDAKEAKSLGKSVIIRNNWDNIRLKIMTEILYVKFGNKDLFEKLLLTGKEELVETNSWGDTFWGVCNGMGENNLGRILMSIRDTKESYLYEMYARLRKDETHSYVIKMKVIANSNEDAYYKTMFYINSGNSGYVFSYIEKIWFDGTRQLIPV